MFSEPCAEWDNKPQQTRRAITICSLQVFMRSLVNDSENFLMKFINNIKNNGHKFCSLSLKIRSTYFQMNGRTLFQRVDNNETAKIHRRNLKSFSQEPRGQFKRNLKQNMLGWKRLKVKINGHALFQGLIITK